ncbi:MAG: pyridoxal-phosphate dependent enzyme [Pseudomonadota bacterium]|nr:pyridoxal-phosphate dependent enzyme [Pseudomonadota bacterium]
MLLTPQPTPIQEINDPLLDCYGIRLLIKRSDLVHPTISGNKWYKLKHNLLAARQQGYQTLLTFGGAYSNHIHALAAAGHEYGFKTIGMIRGETYQPLNATLQFAVDHGMMLHYLNRADYRLKESVQFVEQLQQRFGEFYLLPEGGTNELAVQGCRELLADVVEPFDLVACACGTGGSFAGVVAALNGKHQALAVAVLKGAEFLRDVVQQWVLQSTRQQFDNWQIESDYHHGGYAKTTPELLAFVRRFERLHGIPLDPVYTGKLFFALYVLVQQQHFARGTTLLAIHSGGLQGRAGFGLN